MRSLLTLRLLTYSPSGAPGGRAHHLAARAARRRAQLGLPLRLAPGRQHRHRARSSASARSTRPAGSWVAAARQPAGAAPPAGAAHPGRPSRAGRTRPARLARLRRQRARSGSATARPTSTSSTATAGCSTPPGSSSRRATALYSETWRAMRGFADLVARRWQRAGRGHLGGPRRRRPPRALQADGLARARPCPAHRRDPPAVRPGRRRRWQDAREAIARRRSASRASTRHGQLHPQLRLARPRRRPADPAR